MADAGAFLEPEWPTSGRRQERPAWHRGGPGALRLQPRPAWTRRRASKPAKPAQRGLQRLPYRPCKATSRRLVNWVRANSFRQSTRTTTSRFTCVPFPSLSTLVQCAALFCTYRRAIAEGTDKAVRLLSGSRAMDSSRPSGVVGAVGERSFSRRVVSATPAAAMGPCHMRARRPDARR
jgi:hypothetical protein